MANRRSASFQAELRTYGQADRIRGSSLAPGLLTAGLAFDGHQDVTADIDALVQSCTGGRTESLNHETTLKLAHELLPGHVVTPGPRRAAW